MGVLQPGCDQGGQGKEVPAVDCPDVQCLEVCIYGGMEVIDGVAVIDRDGEEHCKVCGRCERACPNGAVTISIEEDGVDRMIARIESSVDVS